MMTKRIFRALRILSFILIIIFTSFLVTGCRSKTSSVTHWQKSQIYSYEDSVSLDRSEVLSQQASIFSDLDSVDLWIWEFPLDFGSTEGLQPNKKQPQQTKVKVTHLTAAKAAISSTGSTELSKTTDSLNVSRSQSHTFTEQQSLTESYPKSSKPPLWTSITLIIIVGIVLVCIRKYKVK